MNFAKKILFAVFVFVAAVVLTAVFFSEPILKSVLTAQIAAKSGLNAQLAGAHFELWPSLRIKATGLELRRPNAPDEGTVLSADELSFSLPYSALLTGRPMVTDIGLAHPVLRVEAAMQAARRANGTATKSGPDVFVAGPLVVTDGAIIDDNLRRRVTGRIDGIGLRAEAARDGGLSLSIDGRTFGKTFHADAKAVSAADLIAGRPTRVDIAAMADPNAAPALVLRTNLRASTTQIAFDDVAGAWQRGKLNASGSIRFDGEAPALAANVRVDRLDLGSLDFAKSSASTDASSRDAIVLSDETLDLKSLRLVDAAIDLKAGELRVGGLSLTNVGLKTTLDKGALRLALTPVDLYQGKISANALVDASRDTVTQNAKLAIDGVKAGPLLADVAGMRQFDGTLQMHADLNASGDSVKGIVNSLAGKADLAVKDGVVTGHKVPDLFRSVASYLPSAWRSLTDRITINSMTATFAVTNGIAATQDLRLVSPVADITGKGNVDLAAQTFDLRFDPKVKSGTERPTQTANALDLGAAILVRGPWSDPQVSADLSGLMRDPQKTLDTLQNLGQQFLGNSDKSSQIPADDILKGVGGLLKGFGSDTPRGSR